MLNKLFNNTPPILKSYLKLPLWSKIAIPVGAFLVIGWIVAPLLKLALLVGAVGLAAYFFMSMGNNKN